MDLRAGSNGRMWVWIVAGGILLVMIVVAVGLAYGGGDSGGGSGY